MNKFLRLIALLAIFACSPSDRAFAQNLEKVLITHSSESISITSLINGITKEVYSLARQIQKEIR